MSKKPTRLIYQEIESLYTHKAVVQEVTQYQNKPAIILDQTLFYPQSPSQPCDTGTITHKNSTFNVTDVQLDNDIVYHMGNFDSESLSPTQEVTITINKDRRTLNSRYHTAGDIINLAIRIHSIDLKPHATHRYPDNAYNEYTGNFSASLCKEVHEKIQHTVEKIAHDADPITKVMGSPWELESLSEWIPDNLPLNAQVRAVIVDNYPAILCNGTHVENTKDVGVMIIEKIEQNNGTVRITYSVT